MMAFRIDKMVLCAFTFVCEPFSINKPCSCSGCSQATSLSPYAGAWSSLLQVYNTCPGIGQQSITKAYTQYISFNAKWQAEKDRLPIFLIKYLLQWGVRLSTLVPTDQHHTLYGLCYCESRSSKCTVILRQIIEYGRSHIFYLFHFTLYGAVHRHAITDLGTGQVPLPWQHVHTQ